MGDIPQSPGCRSRAKTELRARFLAARAARGAGRAGGALRDRALLLPELSAATTVAAYVATAGEPDTGPLLAALSARGCRVLVPVVTAGAPALDWAEWAGTDRLRPGAFGIPEPVTDRLGPQAADDVPLLLIPALAVDRVGTRLGRGGGYYDRLLSRLADTGRATPPNRLVVAVVYAEEVVERLPREPHDRPVDGALTPAGYLPLG